MAIFCMLSSKKEAFLKEATVVHKDSILSGNIEGSSSVQIDGVFRGDINVEGTVIISESGKVAGDIIASKIEVEGHLDGNVNTKEIMIRKDAHYIGDIKTMDVAVYGKFDGSIICEDLYVDEDAEVNSMVDAKNILVRGKIEGEIASESISIKETAYIKGKLYVNSISNIGGKIEGSITEYRDILGLDSSDDEVELKLVPSKEVVIAA